MSDLDDQVPPRSNEELLAIARHVRYALGGSETREAHLLGWAWTIIANASEGDWTKQTPEWQEAAANWRDALHTPTPEVV